jgi:hypothetical protein
LATEAVLAFPGIHKYVYGAEPLLAATLTVPSLQLPQLAGRLLAARDGLGLTTTAILPADWQPPLPVMLTEYTVLDAGVSLIVLVVPPGADH